MERMYHASPATTARVAGLFYLLTMVLGGVATFFRGGLVIKGDAAATAANIMAHHSMWLLGYSTDVLFVASYVVVVALFYRLFKAASPNVSLVATFFGLGGCIILAIAVFFELATLIPLDNAAALTGFSVQQVQSLAFMFIRFYADAYAVSLAFFSLFMILTGYVVFHSAALPRLIGALFSIGGLGWLVFLWPPFGQAHLAYIVPFSIGEGVIALWLLIKGVDAAKWKAQVAAAKAAYN